MSQRVAFLIPQLGIGGAERVASELSFALKNVETEAIVFELVQGFDFAGPVHSLELKLDDLAGRVTKLSRLFPAIGKLVLLSQLRGYDAIVSFTTPANLVLMMMPVAPPRLVTVHSTESALTAGPLAGPVRASIRLLYGRADGLLAVSESAAKDLREHFKIETPVTVVHNPTDVTRIRQLSKVELHAGWDQVLDSRTISTMGRFVPAKGHWHLLRAFSHLKKARPDLKLLMIGGGPLSERLKNECDSLGLRWSEVPSPEKDVYFTGFQENPFAFLARTELFVFPSRVEGFGNAIVEALACGLTVVASDCQSGPREILLPDGSSSSRSVETPVDVGIGTLMPPWPDLAPFETSEEAARLELMWAEVVNQWLTRGVPKSAAALRRAMDFDSIHLTQLWRDKILDVLQRSH